MAPSPVENVTNKIEDAEIELKCVKNQLELKDQELKSCPEVHEDYVNKLKDMKSEKDKELKFKLEKYASILNANQQEVIKNNQDIKQYTHNQEKELILVQTKGTQIESHKKDGEQNSSQFVKEADNYHGVYNTKERMQIAKLKTKDKLRLYEQSNDDAYCMKYKHENIPRELAAKQEVQSLERIIKSNVNQMKVNDIKIKPLQRVIHDYDHKLKTMDTELDKKASKSQLHHLKVKAPMFNSNSNMKLKKHKNHEFCNLETVESTKKLVDLRSELEVKDEQIKSYQEVIDDMIRNFNTKESKTKASCQTVDKFNEKEDCTKKLECLYKELKSYKSLAESYANELDLKEDQLKSLKDKNKMYEMELDKKNIEFTSLKRDMDKKTIKNNMYQYKDCCKSIDQVLNSKEKSLIELQKNNDMLQKSNDDLHKELDIAKVKTKKYLAEILALRDELNMLTALLKRLYLSRGSHSIKFLKKTREAIILGLKE